MAEPTSVAVVNDGARQRGEVDPFEPKGLEPARKAQLAQDPKGLREGELSNVGEILGIKIRSATSVGRIAFFFVYDYQKDFFSSYDYK